MMNPTQPNHQLSPNWDRGEGTPGPCLRMGFSGQGPAARPPLPAARAHAFPQGPGHGPGSVAPGLEAPSSLGNLVVGEDRVSRCLAVRVCPRTDAQNPVSRPAFPHLPRISYARNWAGRGRGNKTQPPCPSTLLTVRGADAPTASLRRVLKAEHGARGRRGSGRRVSYQ